MHVHRKIHLLPGKIRCLIVLGELDLKRCFLAGRNAGQAFLEIGQHLALAKDNRYFTALPAFYRLALQRAVEIHYNPVFQRAGTFHAGPGRFLAAQVIQHIVVVSIADLHIGALHLDFVEARQRHLGQHFERRDIGEIGLVFADDGLDGRAAGRIEVFLHDRVGIALLHEVGQHFLANLLAVMLFDDLGRNLAGTKSLDLRGATHAHQPRFNLFLYSFSRQLDAHTPLQRAGGLHSDHHDLLPAYPATTAPAASVFNKIHKIQLITRQQMWCERRDSNSHGLPHRNLNPARLPIPPLSQVRAWRRGIHSGRGL